MVKHIRRRLVICSSPNGRGIAKYAEYLKKLIKGDLITCSERTRWFVLWEAFGILRYTRELRDAEVVIFSNTRVSPLLWLFLDWKRVTVVVHDLMDTDAESFDISNRTHRDAKRPIVRRVNTWIIRKSIEKAGRVMFNSKYTEYEVRRWIGKDYVRSCVISPPPSFESLVSKGKSVLSVKSEDKKIFKVLAVTGTSKNKAHETYVKFHRELEEKTGERIEIVIYGIELSKATSEFRNWAIDNQDRVAVKYRRREEEMLDDYLDCDFVVSLSTKEGYGMPVADSVGFGIPVIARTIESYRGIKESLDSSGIMFLEDDISKCAEKAAEIMTRSVIKTGKNERMERYRQFCIKSQTTAFSELKGFERD